MKHLIQLRPMLYIAFAWALVACGGGGATNTDTTVQMVQGKAYPLTEEDIVQKTSDTAVVTLDTMIATGDTTVTLMQGSATIVSE